MRPSVDHNYASRNVTVYWRPFRITLRYCLLYSELKLTPIVFIKPAVKFISSAVYCGELTWNWHSCFVQEITVWRVSKNLNIKREITESESTSGHDRVGFVPKTVAVTVNLRKKRPFVIALKLYPHVAIEFLKDLMIVKAESSFLEKKIARTYCTWTWLVPKLRIPSRTCAKCCRTWKWRLFVLAKTWRFTLLMEVISEALTFLDSKPTSDRSTSCTRLWRIRRAGFRIP